MIKPSRYQAALWSWRGELGVVSALAVLTVPQDVRHINMVTAQQTRAQATAERAWGRVTSPGAVGDGLKENLKSSWALRGEQEFAQL